MEFEQTNRPYLSVSIGFLEFVAIYNFSFNFIILLVI